MSRDVIDIERREDDSTEVDQLDEAFLFARSIDIDTYDRHKDRLRQELTLLNIDRHSGELETIAIALDSRVNSIAATSSHGRNPAVCTEPPEL